MVCKMIPSISVFVEQRYILWGMKFTLNKSSQVGLTGTSWRVWPWGPKGPCHEHCHEVGYGMENTFILCANYDEKCLHRRVLGVHNGVHEHVSPFSVRDAHGGGLHGGILRHVGLVGWQAPVSTSEVQDPHYKVCKAPICSSYALISTCLHLCCKSLTGRSKTFPSEGKNFGRFIPF